MKSRTNIKKKITRKLSQLIYCGLFLIAIAIPSTSINAKENANALMILAYDGDSWHPYTTTIMHNKTIKPSSWRKIEAIKDPAYLTWQAISDTFYIKGNDGKLSYYDKSEKKPKILPLLSGKRANHSYTQLRAYHNGVTLVELRNGKSRETQLIEFGTQRDNNGLIQLSSSTLLKQSSAQFHPFKQGKRLFYAHVSCRESCDPLIQEVWQKDLVTGKASQLTLLNATSYLHSVDENTNVGFISSNQQGYYHLGRLNLSSLQFDWLTSGPVTDSFPSIDHNGELYFLRRDTSGSYLMQMSLATSTTTDTAQRLITKVALPKEIQKIRYLELSE